MCEEEHAIDNLRPLETIIMSYLFREGMVLCFATRRWAFFGKETKSTAKILKCKWHPTEFPMRSVKIKIGNMEFGTRVQAGMEVTVNRASQEQWQNQDRKYKNLLENVCENRSDAEHGFQSGPFSAQSAKHFIFCTAQGGNASPKVVVLRPLWVWKHRLTHNICKNRSSKMCFPPRAGSTFS